MYRWIYHTLLGQLLNFKLFGMTYLVGIKIKSSSSFYFRVPFAKWVEASGNPKKSTPPISENLQVIAKAEAQIPKGLNPDLVEEARFCPLE